MNNLYLFLYFFAYHLATSGVPPVVRVPPVENRWCIVLGKNTLYYTVHHAIMYSFPLRLVIKTIEKTSRLRPWSSGLETKTLVKRSRNQDLGKNLIIMALNNTKILQYRGCSLQHVFSLLKTHFYSRDLRTESAIEWPLYKFRNTIRYDKYPGLFILFACTSN